MKVCMSLCAMALLASLGLSAQERPNIILIMSDDQGYGDAGYLGNERLQTPNLDKMAASALHLDNFYTFANNAQTRATALTGRHYLREGVKNDVGPINPKAFTVAAALKSHGYATGMYGLWSLSSGRTGGWYAAKLLGMERKLRKGRNRPTQQAITVMPWSPMSPRALGFDTFMGSSIRINDFTPEDLVHDDKWISKKKGGLSNVLVDEATDWIENQAKANTPFLACFWFQAGGMPAKQTGPWIQQYLDLNREQSFYYAALTEMDEAIGVLNKSLEKLGIEKNTVIIFCSDGAPTEKGNPHATLKDSKGRENTRVDESPVRVPAFVYWPGVITESRHAPEPSSTMDFYPTILELAGLESFGEERAIDGQSIAPLIKGSAFTRTVPVWAEEGQLVVLPDGTRQSPNGFIEWSHSAYEDQRPSRGWARKYMKAHRLPEHLDPDTGKEEGAE